MNLSIEILNETYIRISCETGIAYELSDAFSFIVPDYRFTPAFKMGRWDGRLRLFNLRDRTIYAGLLPKILEFAKDRDYTVSGYLGPETKSPETAQIEAWAATLQLPGIIPRDYQIAAVRACIAQERAIILSSTGSGKSLSIYLTLQWFKKRTLVIVPTLGLIQQMKSDFISYGCDGSIQTISGGESKDVDSDIVIGTWQSLFRLKKNWFRQFEVVIVDEVHLATAKSLVSIMEKIDHCKYRFGYSGTLDDSKSNQMTLEGLFGSVTTVATTADLMERKILATLDIQALVCKYSDSERKVNRKYEDEIDFLISHPKRNALIRKLVTKLDGNVLVLFQFVERHGEILYDMIKRSTNRPVYYIAGDIKADERERIRKEIDQLDNAILVASVGTSALGINLVSLRHVVFTSPSKAKIRTLQAIGRSLRRSKYKTNATLWDLADDLSWKSRKNHTLKHFMERIKIYAREQFQYRVRNITL